MPTYNFAAGPAVLPRPVLEQVQAELLDYHGSHMSILEISHRSEAFKAIYQSASARLLRLMKLSADEYSPLFLQGGATLQFTMIPLNLATKHHRVAYANTGHWSARAIEEAKKLPDLTVDVVTDAGPDFAQIPAVGDLPADTYDYLHITTNNTIKGLAYQDLPQTGVPLVGDMSSNFLGQDYDFSAFDLIYAGAQKNLAPAGVTIVVVKNQYLAEANDLPSMLNYPALAKKESALNTPPVFQIYVADLVLQWLEAQGGVATMDRLNRQKAGLIYDYLDQSALFTNPVQPGSRSLTNIPFTTGDADLDAQFIQEAAAAGLYNLKGHRSVGGMRASLYNAMPLDGAVALRDFMKQLEAKH